MTKSTKLIISHMKKNKLNIYQLNIKLKMFHMFILINLLTTFHRTDLKQELNTLPLKDKLSTHQLKNKSLPLKELPNLKLLVNQLNNLFKLLLNQLLPQELLLDSKFLEDNKLFTNNQTN